MAKRQHEEEHENHERWLVSYADFITLLFAFFTVLYAQSQHDVSKAQELQRSIQKAFRSFLDFGGVQGKFVDNHEATQYLPPPIDVVPQEGTGPLEMQDYIEREIEKEMGSDEAFKDYLDMRTDSIGVRVSLGDSVLFDPASSLIKESALPKLDKIARVLKKTRRRLIVEGHTDDTPVHTAKFPSNWELSSLRASTIVRYLILQHNIPADRLLAVGYADTKPLEPNTNAVNRAKNRRIDILVVTDNKKVGL